MWTIEIRDQIYDEKQNTVKIKVVSCCPDKILKKISSKGGKSVEKIEIVSDEKKKEPEKKKEGGGEKKDGAAEKKGKEGEPKKEAEKDGAKEKKEGGGDKPKGKEPENKPKEPVPVPVSGHPSIFPPVYPVHAYYDPYHQHQMQVSGPRPVPCYQYPGMPSYYGVRDSSRVNYCGGHYDCFSEENPSSCAIM